MSSFLKTALLRISSYPSVIISRVMVFVCGPNGVVFHVN